MAALGDVYLSSSVSFSSIAGIHEDQQKQVNGSIAAVRYKLNSKKINMLSRVMFERLLYILAPGRTCNATPELPLNHCLNASEIAVPSPKIGEGKANRLCEHLILDSTSLYGMLANHQEICYIANKPKRHTKIPNKF